MSSTKSGSGSQQSRKRIPAEQRRRELTAVAHTVMARDGAFGLTTRAVAKEAGVPHGSVHYAFHSKDELIRAVVRDDIDRSTAAFRRFAAPEANTPEHTASPQSRPPVQPQPRLKQSRPFPQKAFCTPLLPATPIT